MTSGSTSAVVDIISFIRRIGTTEDFREQIDEKNAQARHTNTDNAYVDFYG